MQRNCVSTLQKTKNLLPALLLLLFYSPMACGGSIAARELVLLGLCHLSYKNACLARC